MRTNARRSMILTLTILMLVSLLSYAMADVSVTIRANTSVYQSASTSARSVKLTSDTSAKLAALNKGYARVTHGGKTGYVLAKNLVLQGTVKVYTTSKITMYKSASTSSKKVTTWGAETYPMGAD